MFNMEDIYGPRPFGGYSYKQTEDFKNIVSPDTPFRNPASRLMLVDSGGQYAICPAFEVPKADKSIGQLLVERMVEESDNMVAKLTKNVNRQVAPGGWK